MRYWTSWVKKGSQWICGIYIYYPMMIRPFFRYPGGWGWRKRSILLNSPPRSPRRSLLPCLLSCPAVLCGYYQSITNVIRKVVVLQRFPLEWYSSGITLLLSLPWHHCHQRTTPPLVLLSFRSFHRHISGSVQNPALTGTWLLLPSCRPSSDC